LSFSPAFAGFFHLVPLAELPKTKNPAFAGQNDSASGIGVEFGLNSYTLKLST
jgi:hypothetical protein